MTKNARRRHSTSRPRWAESFERSLIDAPRPFDLQYRMHLLNLLRKDPDWEEGRKVISKIQARIYGYRRGYTDAKKLRAFSVKVAGIESDSRQASHVISDIESAMVVFFDDETRARLLKPVGLGLSDGRSDEIVRIIESAVRSYHDLVTYRTNVEWNKTARKKLQNLEVLASRLLVTVKELPAASRNIQLSHGFVRGDIGWYVRIRRSWNGRMRACARRYPT